MISEGSCDTEDWSNDAENSALHNRNKLAYILKYIQMNIFKWKELFLIALFLLHFWSNKCSLGEHKETSFKNMKNLNYCKP